MDYGLKKGIIFIQIIHYPYDQIYPIYDKTRKDQVEWHPAKRSELMPVNSVVTAL